MCLSRYGFNSDGLEAVKRRLQPWRRRHLRTSGVLGVNLGKNKATAEAAEDFVCGIRELGSLADYLVVNVSSPNTPGLRDYQRQEELAALVHKVSAYHYLIPPHLSHTVTHFTLLCAKSSALAQVAAARDALLTHPPLLLKIAPDLSHEEKRDIAAVVCEASSGVDGLIVCNTTVARPSSLQSRHRGEMGGLSGKPVKEVTTQAVRDMYTLTGGGCG